MARRDLTINSLLLAAAIVLLSLEQLFAAKISNAFSYADELLVLILAFCFLFRLLISGRALDRTCAKILLLWGSTCLLALIGNYLWCYQNSIFAIADDAINMAKYMLVFVFVYNLSDYADETMHAFTAVSKILVSVLCVLAVCNTFFDIGLGSDYRYGIRAFTFGSHAGLAAGLICPLLAVLNSGSEPSTDNGTVIHAA